MEEVRQAWLQPASPFRLLLWELTGQKSNPDHKMIERLLVDGALSSLHAVDLRSDAPHHHGTWMKNICGSAERGQNELRRLQAVYVEVIGTELIATMKAVAASHVPEFISVFAPYGDVEFDQQYPWRLENVVNHREMNSYLLALPALRLGIDEYALLYAGSSTRTRP